MTMSTTDPCGCPPTATGERAPGRVHHVILNVTDLARSRAFYAPLLPFLGYDGGITEIPGGVGWYGAGGSFWLKAAAPALSADGFHKDRVGLCEIAFAAASREQVDALHRALVGAGACVLDPPREYDYTPGYYAVFFADPDGMKLELVHIPG
jgi:catechol 2,3-dioxygenase-like lactoylglutathione lyase family enzyme